VHHVGTKFGNEFVELGDQLWVGAGGMKVVTRVGGEPLEVACETVQSAYRYAVDFVDGRGVGSTQRRHCRRNTVFYKGLGERLDDAFQTADRWWVSIADV
jgi:hypothetical protein